MKLSAELLARSEALPQAPGVYLFKDLRGRVIYVGKARNIRARVRQYLLGQDERMMVDFLVAAAAEVDAMVVHTEKEALILEDTLIKRHRPRYNVKLVDDTAFLHLVIDPEGHWPRFQLVRRVEAPKKARSFGPFTSASRARGTLELLQRRFPLRTCSDRELESRDRPCLMHQMGRCVAPCVGLSTKAGYREIIEQALLFLEGRSDELQSRLTTAMEKAAEELNFEEAARLRDLLHTIASTIERQEVADTKGGNRDLWGLHREGPCGADGLACLLPVRQGLLQEAIHFPFSEQPAEDAELFSSLLNTWYREHSDIPGEILLPIELPEQEALSQLLSERRGAGVRLRHPAGGTRLLELATQNAAAAWKRRKEASDRQEAALVELARVCRLSRPPRRIECFDNSNIQGTDPVAAMAVFLDGQPSRSHYRRYRVKTVEGADDFATMREILGRRLRRGLNEGDLPDLLVVDGGKGQLNAALAVMGELSKELGEGVVVPMVGIVKPKSLIRHGDREATDRVVLPGIKDPVRLPHNSGALRILQAIRDEVHATAVAYHRRVRDRRTLTSVLELLPGVGPARRKALLSHLGSAEAVSRATEAEIAAVPGIGASLAKRLHAALAEAAGDGAQEITSNAHSAPASSPDVNAAPDAAEEVAWGEE